VLARHRVPGHAQDTLTGVPIDRRPSPPARRLHPFGWTLPGSPSLTRRLRPITDCAQRVLTPEYALTLTPAAPPTPPLDAVTGLLAGRAADATLLHTALKALLEDPSALAAWLVSFDDEERAARCAARSYWHRNGFAKLVLHATPDFRIRLHVWPEGTGRPGEPNPHSHRWDFASSVLCGDGLVSTEYEECADGAPFHRHRYTGGGIDAALISDVHIGLTVKTHGTIATHESYDVTTHVVHTIKPRGTSLIATLLVQGPPKLDSTLVYCAPGQQADQPGVPISADDVRKLMRDMLNAPDGPGRHL